MSIPGWVWWALAWVLVALILCIGYYVFRSPMRIQEDLLEERERNKEDA